jgi:hypothetical protein
VFVVPIIIIIRANDDILAEEKAAQRAIIDDDGPLRMPSKIIAATNTARRGVELLLMMVYPSPWYRAVG